MAGIAGSAVPPPVAQAETGVRESPHPASVKVGKLTAPADQNIVETNAGKVLGYRRGPIYTFKGVPYGAPTGGANRFRPPQPATPWSGIKSCMSFGATSPDNFGILEPNARAPWGDEDAFLLYRGFEHTLASEDCLRLNVFTSGLADSTKRPVMVYMHGGGYSGGSGHDLKCYEGTALAEAHDVVVVTHNHRLNVFGFMNLEEIGGERYIDSANTGLLDIVAVLQWIKENIARFGGDPNRVMIFGQSGGGGKVGCLMAMPAAKGLFHAAAVQSGSILRAAEPESSSDLAGKVLAELGFGKSDLSKLETASTEDLMTAARRAILKLSAGFNPATLMRMNRSIPGWGPTRDGRSLPTHPFDPTAPAIGADIPMIIGTNEHEFINGCDNPDVGTLSDADLNQRVQCQFGNAASGIIAAYKSYYPNRTPFDIYAAIMASGPRSGAFTQGLRKAAQNRAPVYEYIYSWNTPVLSGRPGTFHSAEITMVFNNAAYCDRYTGGGAEAVALADKMSSAWVALAREGKPQSRGLPEWPAYDEQNKQVMIFEAQGRVEKDPEGDGLRLIEAALANK